MEVVVECDTLSYLDIDLTNPVGLYFGYQGILQEVNQESKEVETTTRKPIGFIWEK